MCPWTLHSSDHTRLHGGRLLNETWRPPFISSYSPRRKRVRKRSPCAHLWTNKAFSKDIMTKYVHICNVIWILNSTPPHATTKGSGGHQNKTRANSLTHSLLFGFLDCFVSVWCLYYKENGTTNERPLRSNLKERRQEWILHIKGKGHKKEKWNLLVYKTCGMTPRTPISHRPAGRWIF